MSPKIDIQRVCDLSKNLLRATQPSPQPDDNYRPTHWGDRIYYLVLQASSQNFVSQFSWDMMPMNLCSTVVGYLSGAAPTGSFERLETAVAAVIAERFGNEMTA